MSRPKQWPELTPRKVLLSVMVGYQRKQCNFTNALRICSKDPPRNPICEISCSTEPCMCMYACASVCVSFKRFANGLKTNKTVIIHHVLVAELRRYDITHSVAETGFVMKSETAFI